MAWLKKNNLTAQNFLQHAQMLATLSTDEITVLGIMAQYHSSSDENILLKRDKKIQETMGNKTEAIQAALIRTGLVVLSIQAKTKPKPGLSGTTFGFDTELTKQYYTTSLMDEILKYTSFVL